MANFEGRVLAGRYRVDEFLGRGGMADVYRVWDTQRAVNLAIKVLREEIAEDHVFLRRFRREGDTLAQLQHPHIVRFYGLEESDGLAFMLMDFVDGVTLRKEIFRASGPIPADDIRRYLRPVCAALYYAHNQNLVHCDIKPGNIMLHKNGQIFLADFGIARATESTTSTMLGAGTPAYMAPEQVRSEEPVPQTDVYSLAIILYEMVTTGHRPFTGEMADSSGSTMHKVIWEKLNMEPIRPSRHNPDLSPELEDVIMKALSTDIEDRYPDALSFYQAVDVALMGQEDATIFEDFTQSPDPAPTPVLGASSAAPVATSVASQPVSPTGHSSAAAVPGTESQNWLQKNRNVVIGGGVFVLLLLLFLIFGRGEDAAEPGNTASATAIVAAVEISPTSPAATPVPTQQPTAAPTEQPTLIAAANTDDGAVEIMFANTKTGTTQFWIANEDGTGAFPFTDIERGACQPSFSPDGSQFVFIIPCSLEQDEYPTAQLYIFDMESETFSPLSTSEQGDYDPHWSPDGSKIVFTSIQRNGQPEIWIYDFETDSRTLLVESDANEFNKMARWSPDGSLIAYVSSSSLLPEAIWLMGADGTRKRPFSESGDKWRNTAPRWFPDGSAIMVTQARATGGVKSLIMIPLDDPRSETRLTPEKAPMTEGDFSPDGSHFLFESWPDGVNHNLYMIDLETGEIQLIFDNQAWSFDPVWIP